MMAFLNELVSTWVGALSLKINWKICKCLYPREWGWLCLKNSLLLGTFLESTYVGLALQEDFCLLGLGTWIHVSGVDSCKRRNFRITEPLNPHSWGGERSKESLGVSVRRKDSSSNNGWIWWKHYSGCELPTTYPPKGNGLLLNGSSD